MAQAAAQTPQGAALNVRARSAVLAAGIKDDQLWLNVSNPLGAGALVEVSDDDVEAYANLLLRLVAEVRRQRRNRNQR